MTDPALTARAYSYASRQHAGQFRKGASGDPYINHVTEVAELVAVTLGTDDEFIIAAALLHDVVEDSSATQVILTDMFGEKVAGLVAELTDPDGVPEDQRRQTQIDHAPHLSDAAKAIKVADKISNLREMHRDPPADWSIEERLAYLNWGEAVFSGLQGVNAELDVMFRDAAVQLRRHLESCEAVA